MNIHAKVKDTILKPVDAVFDAIIDPEELSQYFVTTASGPIMEGASIVWNFDSGTEFTIKIIKVISDEFISFEWDASGKNATVEILLKAVEKATTSVTITEDGWELNNEGVQSALNQTQGWTDFLCSLKAYLYCGLNLRNGRMKELM